MNDGLPHLFLRTQTLALSPNGETLYAGFHGGSVWQLAMPRIFNNGFEPGDACAWSTTVGGGC